MPDFDLIKHVKQEHRMGRWWFAGRSGNCAGRAGGGSRYAAALDGGGGELRKRQPVREPRC